jgi:SAM-dependent methyltransferase
MTLQDLSKLPLLGFDPNGRVFDAGQVMHRSISDDYKGRVAEIYRIFRENSLDKKGIVETVLRPDGSLEHRKLPISYPYEWSAGMYKDAVLFHLKLFSELAKVGLTLKDALPSNIVFDHSRPIFVDFLSLIRPARLKDETWLGARGYADARFAVAERMLFPYLVLPLVFFARQQPAIARALLSTRSCNCDGRPPAWRELLRPPPRGPRPLRNYFGSLYLAARLAPDRFLGRHRRGAAFDALIDKLVGVAEALDVTPPRSAYSAYYDEKKEALSLRERSGFLPKQRSILEILGAKRPASVLDIGANTGWYSNLAADLGASVIAFEEDESCVDILYRAARAQERRILPLRGSFADLTREIHGSAALAADYADRAMARNPLYRAGVERLGADLVLLLGLLHHLVLGEGLAIEDLFGVLARLARKTLVLEFVAIDDEKIRGEPGFFANLGKFDAASYNLDMIVQAGRRHFRSVEMRASHPATRAILVFDK